MTSTKFKFTTVTAVVIANMVGTGVFTSLGFQLLDIQSGFVILMLWGIGGLIALCGAMTYAELGAALPRSGGEYNFLSRIYHPAAGFRIRLDVRDYRIRRPDGARCMTFAAYATSIVPSLSSESIEKSLAVGLVAILAVIHGQQPAQLGRAAGRFYGSQGRRDRRILSRRRSAR